MPGIKDESACLVGGFKPTRHEVEVLARYYLAQFRKIQFRWEFEGMTGGYESKMSAFARGSLSYLKTVLGEKKFEEAIASTAEKWERRFAWAREFEKHGPRCKKCGGPPNYYQPPDSCDNCSEAGPEEKGNTLQS